MPKTITLAIDVDGVIRDTLTNEPINGAIRAIHWLEGKGRTIIITTSNDDIGGVRKWLKRHGLNYNPTNRIPKATAYINDRAIRFTNWNDITSYY